MRMLIEVVLDTNPLVPAISTSKVPGVAPFPSALVTLRVNTPRLDGPILTCLGAMVTLRKYDASDGIAAVRFTVPENPLRLITETTVWLDPVIGTQRVGVGENSNLP